ncbi:MAG: CAP domain-containing protein [Caulobacteraceae bacterium]|nr:CAP domain-containing protein [Caulobacteraceae bacterium]
MSALLRLLLVPACLLLLGTAPAQAPTGVDAMLAELNAARTDPQAYAARVRAFRGLFTGDRFQRPGEIAVVTQEGVAAVDEAIRFLATQPALPALGRSTPLDRAAVEHAAEQGRTGRVGHDGADGSSPHDRMRRHGRWRATAEAIAYGPTPEQAVMQLIVDDGVPDRGHRTILFSPTYRLVGAACGPHPVWRTVCVLNFATPAAVSPAGT